MHACCCILRNTVEPLDSGHPWGTTFWPLYTVGVAFIEGLFCTHLGPEFLAVILYSGVAVKRGSTVYPLVMQICNGLVPYKLCGMIK